MKLLLDAGNTRVKWRLLDAAGQRCAEGAAAHEDLSALAADCARWAPEQALGCGGQRGAGRAHCRLPAALGGHGLAMAAGTVRGRHLSVRHATPGR